jgi:hypothetical protein
MRLPNTAHTSRPWRIHELTRDFRLEDRWALPTPGGPDDFPRLVQGIAGGRERHGLCPSHGGTRRQRQGNSNRGGSSAETHVSRRTGPARASSRHPSAGDPHRFRTETMKTTLLDEVLPECVVDVFSGWPRQDFLHRIARIAAGAA